MFDIDEPYFSLLKYRFSDWSFQELLNEIPFQVGEVVLFGKRHKIPRQECFMVTTKDMNYTYSGKELNPIMITPMVRTALLTLTSLTGYSFNSVLANYYRDGNDKMGYHRDDESELGESPVVASISFGGSRYFNFKKEGRQASKVLLEHGDVFIMKPGFQNEFQHAIPPSKSLNEPRISLTFREIVK